MAGPNRGSLIGKMYKVLKQHYKPMSARDERPLLQQMLFACCLENTHYDKAEKVYQHLSSSFFDWNEVRVSTVKELAEAMRDLPAPAAAAANLKSILQNVFEATYSFDLEPVKKQNIGVGIKRLAKYEGASPFVLGYVTQHALGGHSIPLSRGTVDVLYIVGIATEAERKTGNVAGLERAIPKNKGPEFGSLLHQLAADYIANPISPHVKNLFLAINPEAKSRLPKRGQKKPLEAAEKPAAAKSHAGSDGKTAGGKPSKSDLRQKDHSGTHRPEKESTKHLDAKDLKKIKPVKANVGDGPKKRASAGKPAKAANKTSRPTGLDRTRSARSGSHQSASNRLAKRKPR